jgi:hypothetical protein
MTVSVLIPFASDDPWRRRARAHVTDWYEAQGFDVVEGTCPGSWRKAVAVGDAARRASGEILVVADADCLCDGVAPAVAAVEADAPWAIPHTLVHRLDEPATEAVYAGVSPAATTGRAQRPYRGFAGGGIVVLPRDTWDRIPIDPRFEGWGQEDEAWAMALTCLAGRPARLAGDLHHLWHPPPERLSRHLGSATSRKLLGRYIQADRHQAAMRSLLDETRPAVMVR